MSKDGRKSIDEIPNVPKIQYTRGKLLEDYLMRNDPEYRKKYRKRGGQ